MLEAGHWLRRPPRVKQVEDGVVLQEHIHLHKLVQSHLHIVLDDLQHRQTAVDIRLRVRCCVALGCRWRCVDYEANLHG